MSRKGYIVRSSKKRLFLKKKRKEKKTKEMKRKEKKRKERGKFNNEY